MSLISRVIPDISLLNKREDNGYLLAPKTSQILYSYLVIELYFNSITGGRESRLPTSPKTKSKINVKTVKLRDYLIKKINSKYI
jgi:hypothetical protein